MKYIVFILKIVSRRNDIDDDDGRGILIFIFLLQNMKWYSV